MNTINKMIIERITSIVITIIKDYGVKAIFGKYYLIQAIFGKYYSIKKIFIFFFSTLKQKNIC